MVHPREVEFTPFARGRLLQLGLLATDIESLVGESVVAIPVSGGKVLHEGVIGDRMVSVIVSPSPPATVVGVTARSL